MAPSGGIEMQFRENAMFRISELLYNELFLCSYFSIKIHFYVSLTFLHYKKYCLKLRIEIYKQGDQKIGKMIGPIFKKEPKPSQKNAKISTLSSIWESKTSTKK